MKNTIEDLLAKAVEVHEDNVKKGFWTPGEERCIDEVDMLILSEAFEALEADRAGKHANVETFEEQLSEVENFIEENFESAVQAEEKMKAFADVFKNNIKDTVEDELADFCIRILDKIGNEIVVSRKSIVEHVDVKTASYDFGHTCFIAGFNKTFSKFLSNIIKIHASSEQKIILYAYAVAYAEENNIDLSYHIDSKLQYNRTRAYKHGKQY